MPGPAASGSTSARKERAEAVALIVLRPVRIAGPEDTAKGVVGSLVSDGKTTRVATSVNHSCWVTLAASVPGFARSPL